MGEDQAQQEIGRPEPAPPPGEGGEEQEEHQLECPIDGVVEVRGEPLEGREHEEPGADHLEGEEEDPRPVGVDEAGQGGGRGEPEGEREDPPPRAPTLSVHEPGERGPHPDEPDDPDPHDEARVEVGPGDHEEGKPEQGPGAGLPALAEEIQEDGREQVGEDLGADVPVLPTRPRRQQGNRRGEDRVDPAASHGQEHEGEGGGHHRALQEDQGDPPPGLPQGEEEDLGRPHVVDPGLAAGGEGERIGGGDGAGGQDPLGRGEVPPEVEVGERGDREREDPEQGQPVDEGPQDPLRPHGLPRFPRTTATRSS